LSEISEAALYQVGFVVLTAVSTKMAVFWVIAPCVLMIKAARTSETLANFYQITRSYNPETAIFGIILLLYLRS
jgi:hypothetical protein